MVGQIMFVPYNFEPFGWHDCDGSLIAISQNTALFALIGTNYGGDGKTTFALPDMRGRVAVGSGTNPVTNTNYPLGTTGGTEAETITINQLPVHSHSVKVTSSNGNTSAPQDAIQANTRALDKEYYDASNTTNTVLMNNASLVEVGSSLPHNNMMPTNALKCVIAMQGYFPNFQ